MTAVTFSQRTGHLISPHPTLRVSQHQQQLHGENQQRAYQQREQGPMDGEDYQVRGDPPHETEYTVLHGDGHVLRNTSLHQHFAGPATPTTAISRQNSTSSTASSALNESSEQLLRQTLSANGTSRPSSQQSRKKYNISAPTTPKAAGALTPITRHGSPQSGMENSNEELDSEFEGMRHGFEDEYNSEAYLGFLEQVFYMYYTDKRHETGGNPKEEAQTFPLQEWRMRDRLKTISAALVLCLNLGVDPPDVVKTNPCAKLECWVDPTAHPTQKPLEQIGKNLQQQYETLSIRTRYKQYLDPFFEDTKKFCCSLRRNAKDERILFHYNGHGVPKPTSSGEIWVFNKNYTQYIPISLYDLQTWLGAPSLFVYDCSEAGNIVTNFNRFIEKHEQENAELRAKDPNVIITSYSDCIQLAACGAKETLPMNPSLPADLFTCCLTTPIEIAVRFFILQNPLPHNLTVDMAFKIPGRLQERRTPLGELNWIFTAITDTIAWNTLPRPLFKKLFRQDLMVAALFRNFLLAQRIMREYQCHPISSPVLPDTHNHSLWQSWDLAVEMVLSQLPRLLEQKEGGEPYEYQHSAFFTEQLTAFEVYLSQGAVDRKPPDQLPIVLQVLLSQVHRLRALILLSKFLDLGPWAVNLALSIGIFPYVLKLLQSAAAELKPVMVFIWARILAVDSSCQSDLLKENGYQYFIQILSPQSGIPVGNVSEHRAMCAFILAMFCRNFHQGQMVCMAPGVMNACLAHLSESSDNPLLRQWASLCISQLWNDFSEAKWQGIREGAHYRLCELITDPVPEVRAAVLYALRTFLGIPDMTEEIQKIEQYVASAVLAITGDGSNMVRKEVVIFFSYFIKRFENKFLVASYEQLIHEREYIYSGGRGDGTIWASKLSSGHLRSGSATTLNGSIGGKRKDLTPAISENSIFAAVWKAILLLSVDPFPEVAQLAGIVVDYVHLNLLGSPLGVTAQDTMDDISKAHCRPASYFHFDDSSMERLAPDSPTSASRQDGYFSLSLRRSASIAASLKTLALGYGTSDNFTQPIANGKQKRPGFASLPRTPPEWIRPPEEGDHLPSSAPYSSAKHPVSRHFKPRNLLEPPTIPLESRFMEWSIEVIDLRLGVLFKGSDDLKYFREPQMKPTEADEPGSLDYNQRLWRRTRNEKIIMDTQPQKERAARSRWDAPAGIFNNGSQPMRLLFHQFENHLVAVDDKDTVSIWDWSKAARLNRFSNGNPRGTRITEVKFMNEDDVALLMTGSQEGVIRIYRNYESPNDIELVSAWRALTDLLPSNRSSGLVAEWQQGRGTMLAGGDVRVIRVWDAPREVCLQDIPARSGSCITSLTSDQVAGNIFVAGFGDGAVRVYDRRNPPRDAMVRVYKDHKAWVVKTHMQRGGQRELVSGSVSGDVLLWDIRMNSPIRTFNAHTNGMRSLSVHEHAPVMATGSVHHDIKVWNMSAHTTEPLSTFRPVSTGMFHGNRSSPITALTFHPHRMMLACAGIGDNHINMFNCDSKGGI